MLHQLPDALAETGGIVVAFEGAGGVLELVELRMVRIIRPISHLVYPRFPQSIHKSADFRRFQGTRLVVSALDARVGTSHQQTSVPVAELVDAAVFKTEVLSGACRFEPGQGHRSITSKGILL
jgi:hypothetical protein